MSYIFLHLLYSCPIWVIGLYQVLVSESQIKYFWIVARIWENFICGREVNISRPLRSKYDNSENISCWPVAQASSCYRERRFFTDSTRFTFYWLSRTLSNAKLILEKSFRVRQVTFRRKFIPYHNLSKYLIYVIFFAQKLKVPFLWNRGRLRLTLERIFEES